MLPSVSNLPNPLDQHLSRTLGPVVRAIGVSRQFVRLTSSVRFGIAMTYLTMLQLIPALIAGWICHWWSRQTLSDFSAIPRVITPSVIGHDSVRSHTRLGGVSPARRVWMGGAQYSSGQSKTWSSTGAPRRWPPR